MCEGESLVCSSGCVKCEGKNSLPSSNVFTTLSFSLSFAFAVYPFFPLLTLLILPFFFLSISSFHRDS